MNQDGQRRSALQLLALPEVTWERLASLWPELAAVPAAVREQLALDSSYAGYLQRQEADVAAYRRDEALALPDELPLGEISGLSTEIRQLLAAHRPATLGAAARLPGMTPAAITLLLRYVRRRAA